ncbi:MAG: dienelactone hydrolase family protein, partial [Acidimicrobiia bacterium]
MVEFPSNGTTVVGYLATPEAGAGPGLIVIQEWWGLVDHIKDLCDRFAAEGFTALAPDLYHGATTTEPDEAGRLMMGMNLERAARDMAGAVDHLAGHEAVRGQGVGVVGFCMGGGLALWLGTLRPDAVKAVVPYYESFLERFPDVAALAGAREDDVVAAWSGLGYYHRARNLHRGAQHVRDHHADRFPKTLEAALAIPGVGLYT